MNRFSSLFAAMALVVCPGFDSGPATSADADLLTGAWSVNLRVNEAGNSVTEREHGGEVALLAVPRSRRPLWMVVSGFSHAGVFSDDFRAVGVTPPEWERIPVAGARLLPGDSVEIVFNATQDHGNMTLRGVITNDRITGRWAVSGYVMGLAGTFTMIPLR